MQTAITDPSRKYLLISGGDGYSTEVVTGDRLECAFLALQLDAAELADLPAHERDALLAELRDEDEAWEHNYSAGPVRFRQSFEDGYIEAILLQPNRY